MVAIEYHPRLLAQAEIRYLDRKYNVQSMQKKSVLVEDETGKMIRWEDHLTGAIDQDVIERFSLPETGYQQMPVWMADPKTIKILESDFLDWVYRTDNMKIRASQSLKIFAGPEVSEQEFQAQISQAIKDQMELEIEKVKSTYEKKITALEQKLDKEKRDVETAEDRLGQRRLEEAGTHGEMLLALLSKRKKSISSSLTKRRMTAEAKDKLQNEKKDVDNAIANLTAMQTEMKEAIAQLEKEWSGKANDITEITITPLKKDIFVELFGIAWVPYYVVEIDGRNWRICAFSTN
jgi:CII-binding regulator of phage lambda lysogenization HflD